MRRYSQKLRNSLSCCYSMGRTTALKFWRHVSSSLWLHAQPWFFTLAVHPWTRACRNALLYLFALLIGEEFEDERVAFSTRRLMVNDSYRDRLLVPEIEELVRLSDALQLSIPQRKAFFRCFLHLDCMRRSGVTRAELLRYCSLRDTPMTRSFLPSDGAFAVAASAQRSSEFRTQRWDIIQFLSLMFSLCTMDHNTVIRLCMEAISIQVNSQSSPEVGTESVTMRLSREIMGCLTFNFGVPSPVERKLGDFLCTLYTSTGGAANFAEIHGVQSLDDIIALFPVLIFPSVWTQRVIRRRILGDATWTKLAVRRTELQLTGLSGMFVSSSDIIETAKICVSNKRHWTFQAPHTMHTSIMATFPHAVASPTNSEKNHSQSSTPRKILPVDEHVDSIESCAALRRSKLTHFDTFNNQDDVWRVTADSALASAFVWHELSISSRVLTGDDAIGVFRQAHSEIKAATISKDSTDRLRRLLIQQYGYQFTTFLFAKSSVSDRGGGDLVSTESVRKEERRAKQRYQKADQGIGVVEDKAIYWKEYTDLSLKRVFYHNIRTGESRWEMPSTLARRRRKHRKSGKKSPTKSQLL